MANRKKEVYKVKPMTEGKRRHYPSQFVVPVESQQAKLYIAIISHSVDYIQKNLAEGFSVSKTSRLC